MKGDLIGGIVGFLVGTAVLVGAVALGIGTPVEPEPGFFPFLAAVGIVASSAVLVVQAVLGRSSGGDAFGEMRRPAFLMAALALYVAILEPLGYLAATLLVAGGVLRILGVSSWARVVAGSVVIPVITWLLFARALGIDLPAGQLLPFG